jgi:hypothetical protein
MPENLPWELRLTLRGGSVFYSSDRALTSADPHYFIVVNSKPLDQQLLILTIVTSQVEKVRRRRRNLPGTTVEIGPADYNELSVLSIVDCNVIFRRSLRELVEKIERREVISKNDVPARVLASIRTALLASPLIETEIKDLLR